MTDSTFKTSFVSRGQKITGKVLTIGDREVLVDVGAKSEGVIGKRELLSSYPEIKIGDEITAYVANPEDHSGLIFLTLFLPTSGKIRIPSEGWQRVIGAFSGKQKIKGRVLDSNKGGFMVEVFGLRGFLPSSQVDFEQMLPGGEIKDELSLYVLEADPQNNRLILSQRGQPKEELLEKLERFGIGQKITGRVVAVSTAGVFVEVKDELTETKIEGFIYIQNISWEKVEDLSGMFKMGQEIKAKVLGIDKILGRLNLSIRGLQPDPFEKLVSKYQEGDSLKGVVSGINESGMSVKLDEGIEGWVPTLSLGASMVYKEGEKISVAVEKIDQNRRRVILSPLLVTTKGLVYK